MYLRTLKAVHSAKFFWEEIFMPKSQLGGILYIFPPGDSLVELLSEKRGWTAERKRKRGRKISAGNNIAAQRSDSTSG